MQTHVTLPLAVTLLAFVSPAGDQARSASQAPADPIFRVESELVVMHVSVRDRRGRYVTGLGREAFTVIDAGQPQTLSMFSGDEVPASVAFLIDNSSSMQPHRERVAAAAAAFAASSHTQDEISILTFNEDVRVAFGPARIGAVSPAVLRAVMSSAITARGMSAIYDGILAGLRQVADGAHTRQVLIVVSDGADNASTATLDAVRREVRESDATIYSVVLTDTLARDGNPRLMRRLADETGGESFQPQRLDDIPEVLERIARDIRSAYTLAYTPSAGVASGAAPGRREVRVYVRAPDGRPLRVRARDGYFARVPPGSRP
jgi:Ca-activated chloride channel family protein